MIMRKHCGNCANHRKETNQFSDECGKCVAAILPNGEQTDPSHWRAKPMTRIEKIRSMSVEELAKVIFHSNEPEMFCKGSDECCRRVDAGEDIPQEECLACAAKWLLEEV